MSQYIDLESAIREISRCLIIKLIDDCEDLFIVSEQDLLNDKTNSSIKKKDQLNVQNRYILRIPKIVSRNSINNSVFLNNINFKLDEILINNS